MLSSSVGQVLQTYMAIHGFLSSVFARDGGTYLVPLLGHCLGCGEEWQEVMWYGKIRSGSWSIIEEYRQREACA